MEAQEATTETAGEEAKPFEEDKAAAAGVQELEEPAGVQELEEPVVVQEEEKAKEDAEKVSSGIDAVSAGIDNEPTSLPGQPKLSILKVSNKVNTVFNVVEY